MSNLFLGFSMRCDESDPKRVYAWGRKINIIWGGTWGVK